MSPGFPVRAAWAYNNLNRVPRAKPPCMKDLLDAMRRGCLEDVAATCYNALEFAICDKFPLVDMIRDFLLESGCLTAHISGSGPTVYGLCRPEKGHCIRTAAEVHFADTCQVWETSISASPKVRQPTPGME